MDDAGQIAMTEAAIASGEYDALAVPAIVPDMWKPVIDKAVDKGLTVVTFGVDAPGSKRSCFVGTSPFAAGQNAGELLAKNTGGKAVINVISGKPDEADLVQRIAGMEDAIKKYPDMKVCCVDNGPGGLTENVSKLAARLVSSPEVNTFFGSMAEGGPAVLTLYDTNADRFKGTHTVTMDDLPQTLDGIRQGKIDGAIVQAQYNWGFGAMYQLHRLLQKGLECTADSTDTGTVAVTKDNVDSYSKETMDPKKWLDLEAQEPK
jgi:ribose transport system substrate-binding protein